MAEDTPTGQEVNYALPLKSLNAGRYGAAGVYNVVKDYDWTLSPKTKLARKKVPIMYLTQYEMDSNALIANLKYWVRPIFDKNSNPYKGLYRATPTGVVFQFPWFEEFHHNVNQNWDEFKGLETSSVFEKVQKGLSLITNSPGIAINSPKVWKSAGRATVPYSITLFNTTQNPKTSIKNNQKLINRLIASTLHDQQGPILAVPPSIYVLNIPGVRYCPACTISNLEVSNIGTLVKTGGVTVPEAYRIKFSINELISESRQIYEGAIGGSKVESIIEGDSQDAEEQDAVLENQANQNNIGLEPGQAVA